MNTKQLARFLLPLTLLILLSMLLLPSRTAIFAQDPEDRWAGVVSDENGEPLAATVTINGHSVQADADGFFELEVEMAEDNRYVINAEMFGYASVSNIHIGSPIERMALTLKKAQRFEIDPSQAVEIKDERGTYISIPPDSLFDADGEPATEPLQLFLYTYDLEEEAMPGDMGALDREGQPLALESLGVFYAHFSDADGNEYNLAEGREAKILIPVDRSYPDPPETIPLWSYDEEKGLWLEEGEAYREGEAYIGKVSHFSYWNFDVEKREPACIRLTVDDEYLTANTPIEVKAVLNSPTQVRTLSLTQSTNVLYNLPANTLVDFYMPPSSPTPFATVNTGAPWGGTSTPPKPYDKCNAELHIDGKRQTGTITGMKFHDLNGNGVKDADEPGLEGWEITLTDANRNTITTTTDADGNYQFTNLPPGSTSISEVQQSGWVQTYPPTVKHTLVLTPGYKLEQIDFGNTEPCENPSSDGCMAGQADNFDRSDGSEPSSPSQELLDWANGRGKKVLSEFDVLPTDRYFLHTFGESDTDTCLSGDCLIVGAKLTLSLKGGPSSLASNDTIGFRENGEYVWSQHIHNLVPSGTWGAGQVATITLDLANLPANGAGVTNVLAALQDGDFDFYIADDTGIDFAELIVEKCCDCTPPPPDMVAWWHLDETSGTDAADIAMHPNDGTHFNNPTPVTGMVDGALSFDGSNQYVEVPDHSEINFGAAITGTDAGDFSVDAWVKLDPNNTGIKTIIDKRTTGSPVQGYTLFIQHNKLYFQLADGVGSGSCSTSPSSSCTNYDSGVNITDGQWHFVAVTIDRDKPDGGHWYVDGVEVGTRFNPTYRMGSLSNSAPLRIARHANWSHAYLNGVLDEIELFDRVLDPNEINAIYKAGSAGKCKCIEEEVTTLAGVEDEFSTANGTELTYRSPGFDSYITYNTDGHFDETSVNRAFGQTFELSDTRRICDAWLEIRVKPLGEIDRNDAINLNFINALGQQAIPNARWGRYFGSGNASAGLLSSEWGSTLTPVTFNLHLSQLPMADGSLKDIVPILDQLRYLDVRVSDDTSVDYVKLRVAYCCDEDCCDPEELSDFGDAPDSTNHFTPTMTTYPSAVIANFPTVFDADPAPGPKHVAPKAEAWLGEGVSMEKDADLFPDLDTLNNIYPPTNVADRDLFDDGVDVANLALPECGMADFSYTVNSVGSLSEWYVNAWFDFNQDGDWDDIYECQAPNGRYLVIHEWAVQDQAITVSAGTGLQPFTTPSFAAMGSPESEMWMRVTLSEARAATPADGRGPTNGFEYGETEDYLLPPREIEACDLTIEKRHNDDFVVGQNGSYSLVVTNVGSTDCDPTIRVNDLLPTGLSYISASGSGWSCSNSGATVSCSNGNSLAPAASSNINLTVDVEESAAPGVTNCAEVQGADDTNLSNNESCDETPVVTGKGKCDLSIDKSHEGETFHYGQQGVYNLAVSNMGASDCEGRIEVKDRLPEGMSVPWTSTTIGPWTCSADAFDPQTIGCSHPGPLSPVSSLPQISFTVDVPPVSSAGGAGWNGDIAENCATVNGSNDSDETNNESCDEVIVTLPNGSVILVLDPPTVMTGVGETFELPIVVHAGTQDVDGASAHLNFDPAQLEVVSIAAGSDLSTVILNQFDNESGQLDFAAGSFDTFPSDSFTLATVTFNTTALTDEDGTAVEFNSTLPRNSDVTFDGSSVLDHTEESTIFIENATLTGAVTLQGRPAPPHPRWSVPLRVSFTIPGESSPAYSFTPTTDENGHFPLSGIAPGTYEVRVKHSHTLQNKQTVTLLGGDNGLIDFGTLREGDANDDNYVTLVDFSILVSTFAKCEDDAGYDARADFNGDGCVTLIDFSLMRTNFAQSGDHRPEGGSQQAPLGNASLIIDQPIIQATAGDTYLVTVRLEADTAVDGAAAYIDFDQSLLKVNSIKSGEVFDLELQRQFDNQTGTIEFAAGTLESLPLLGGEGLGVRGDLLLIELEAIGDGESALLFQFDMPRRTEVTAGGQSVLSEYVDGSNSTTPTALAMQSLTTQRASQHSWLALLFVGLLMASLVGWKRWRC